MNDQSDSQNELSRVLKKICEIAEKSADGDYYIFRGETRLHKKPPYYGESPQTFVANIWMILRKRIFK